MADLKETDKQHPHPWELSRADSMLKHILPHLKNSRKTIADIGCGDLYFSKQLINKSECTIHAVDTGFDDLSSENENIILHNDIESLNDNTIEIAVLMDVLEHIEKPHEFLSQVLCKMKTDGLIFITVPAFQHLFSEHDIFLKHYRRYNTSSLRDDLRVGGLRIEKMFYFYSSLYIIRIIQFVISKILKSDNMVQNIVMWSHDEKSIKTRFLRCLLNMDFAINKCLGRFSFFGLSLFAVCSVKK